uniref:Uncharacterized protein n=1 Tax=Octopus bimaculoides TaxID=37653 RepID=A0A0L8HP34_OCTBM
MLIAIKRYRSDLNSKDTGVKEILGMKALYSWHNLTKCFLRWTTAMLEFLLYIRQVYLYIKFKGSFALVNSVAAMPEKAAA